MNYLESEWSERIAEKFIIDCYAKLDLLANTPKIGSASNLYVDVRRILITKHIALYYKVEQNEVTLLSFFDLRQSPERNLFE